MFVELNAKIHLYTRKLLGIWLCVESHFLVKIFKVIPFSNLAVNSLNEHHPTAVKLRKGLSPTAKEVMTGHPSGCTLYEELGSFYEAQGDANRFMECRKEDIGIDLKKISG